VWIYAVSTAFIAHRPQLRIARNVRRRIAVMLVVVVLVFVVCIIPDAVMSALYLGYTESDSYLVKAFRRHDHGATLQ